MTYRLHLSRLLKELDALRLNAHIMKKCLEAAQEELAKKTAAFELANELANSACSSCALMDYCHKCTNPPTQRPVKE
jgi:hypothetical protein